MNPRTTGADDPSTSEGAPTQMLVTHQGLNILDYAPTPPNNGLNHRDREEHTAGTTEQEETRIEIEDALREIDHIRTQQLTEQDKLESPSSRQRRLLEEEARRLTFEQVSYSKEKL